MYFDYDYGASYDYGYDVYGRSYMGAPSTDNGGGTYYNGYYCNNTRSSQVNVNKRDTTATYRKRRLSPVASRKPLDERSLTRGPRHHYSPRRQGSERLRPGPLVQGPFGRSSEFRDCADRLVRHELERLPGKVEVVYESARRFGRFDMNDSQFELSAAEKDDCLDGLSRLWQTGEGYVYVWNTSGSAGRAEVYIFQVLGGRAYEKVTSRRAREMVQADPLWKTLAHMDVKYM
jgi:hypothetical protein